MSHSQEYIKGALDALNEVQAMGLSMAMIAGIAGNKEAAECLHRIITDATNPLISKYKEMAVKK
ncbi:hypothetical protein ACEV6Q_17985 [Enterobacter ludwigii]|uniref:hypothetical protein n=1 Tax=Enterobacter ludwigii TaxID=299767 RepID=UPI003BEECB59